MSSDPVPRVRRRPEERREEIAAAAAEIALHDGLERITVRSVAARLGVRPGLIGHYFPAIEDLVIEAFERSAAAERASLLPTAGTPLERIVAFLRSSAGPASHALARLWLNARHLARFTPRLADALDEQERLDRERLVALLEEAVASGDVTCDPAAAAIRIWMAVDGRGAYANSRPFSSPASDGFVVDTAAWALGLDAAALHAAVAAA